MTFEELLAQTLEAEAETAYIEVPQREALLEELKSVTDEEGARFFDRSSLRSMGLLFERGDEFHAQLKQAKHPARLLLADPSTWLEQSYTFMYDRAAMLRVIGYFGAGKTPYEKEVLFRSLIHKLIKTLETIRIITEKEGFLTQYLGTHIEFQEEFLAVLKEQYPQKTIPSLAEAVAFGLHAMVDDISDACIQLLQELNISFHESAQTVLEQNKPYEALILVMRHAGDDLLGNIGSEDYVILIEEFGSLLRQSFFHQNAYVFQYLKRQYMLDWLVHTLRNYDESEEQETFYQEGKADIYEKFEPLQISADCLENMRSRKALRNGQVIGEEWEQLEALTEDDFYQLLRQIYTHYKEDGLISHKQTLDIQALASGGDTTWEEKAIIAQVHKKVDQHKGAIHRTGKLHAQMRRFTSMLKTLKHVTSSFVKIGKASAARRAPQADEKKVGAAPKEPPPPPLRIGHQGVPLVSCFPVPASEVSNPIKNQKQDICFNNSDTESHISPIHQEFFVNFFNFDKEGNHPLNKQYIKFSNAIMAILRSYENDTRSVQKRFSMGGSVQTITEDVLYLQIRPDIIMAFGNTNMGQSRSCGASSDGRTCYFRVFVKGELMKGLAGTSDVSMMKEFQLPEKKYVFKEVIAPDHFMAFPKYEAFVIDSLLAVIESLPESEFQLLHDEQLIGFINTIQRKASQLIDKGCTFKRAEKETGT